MCHRIFGTYRVQFEYTSHGIAGEELVDEDSGAEKSMHTYTHIAATLIAVTSQPCSVVQREEAATRDECVQDNQWLRASRKMPFRMLQRS